MIRQYWSGNVITGVGRIRDGLKVFKGGNFGDFLASNVQRCWFFQCLYLLVPPPHISSAFESSSTDHSAQLLRA